MPTETPAKRPDQYVGKHVRIARENKRWKQSDLVARLEELGYTQWRQTKVAKIENGETKRLSLEDALALAAALGVKFEHLITPWDGDVEVAPKLVRPAAEVRLWLRGERPLVAADERIFYFGDLVPDSDAKSYLRSADEAGELVLTPGLREAQQARESEQNAS